MDEPRGTKANPLCHWHDEEIKAMKQAAAEVSLEVELLTARIPQDFSATYAVLLASVANITKALETQFVTRAEFEPYKKTLDKVFALLVTAVVVGVLGLLWKVGR